MLRRYALAWLLLPFLAACGDDGDGTGPDGSLDGTYALVEVNGEAPPVVIYTEQTDQGTVDVEVTGGNVVLNGGDYTLTLTLRLVQAAFEHTFRDTGTFAVSGSAITFDSSDPAVTESMAGVVSGNEIRFVASDPQYGDFSVVFRK